MIYNPREPTPAPFEAYLGLIYGIISVVIGAELGIISIILEKIL